MNASLFRCSAAAAVCLLSSPAQADAPLATFFAGPDAGTEARCLPFSHNLTLPLPFPVFPGGQAGGVRVATGDVNGDGRADVIVGAGPGGSREIKIYDGVTRQLTGTIPLTGAGYTGGVWVAAGDVNGDGRADIVAGAGSGGDVQVFSGSGFGVLMTLSPYPTTFAGGVRVAAGDYNSDGLADIITGPGPGGSPVVKVYSGANKSELASLLPYATNYFGGIFVAAGRLDADTLADIVVAPGPTTTEMPLKVITGPTHATVRSFPLPPSPNASTIVAVGGAASTSPQPINYIRDGKLFVFDPVTEATVKVIDMDVPRMGTSPVPFAVGDVSGDGKPDIVLGSMTLPMVEIITSDFAKRLFDKYPEGTAFHGGISVAAGDLNGDGTFDMIMGAGTGGSANIKTCTGTDGSLIDSFSAFPAPVTFPVNVAAGDINGDGKDDIIVAPGTGGGPQVKVFQSGNQSLLKSFLAYNAAFTGGVRVAAGDVNGDGVDDIVTGTGAGVTPQVKVFSGTNLDVLRDFLPEAASFTGGVYVAAGDLNGDGRADIVTGTGSGLPMVRVFDAVDGSPLGAFLAYDPGFTGGVRVAVGDVDGDSVPEIICSPGPGMPPEVRCFDFPGVQRIFTFQPYPATFTSGVFISSWTPPAAKVTQLNAGRNSTGKMELTVQAPKGRTLYFDSSINLLDWTQVESLPGTGAPATLSTTPPAGLEFFVRARVQ